MHAMDKVDEKLVVEGFITANVFLQCHPDLFNKLLPTLDLQLLTTPRRILSVIQRRKPCRRGQQLYPDLFGVRGVEMLLESIDDELLDCPGNRQV